MFESNINRQKVECAVCGIRQSNKNVKCLKQSSRILGEKSERSHNWFTPFDRNRNKIESKSRKTDLECARSNCHYFVCYGCR